MGPSGIKKFIKDGKKNGKRHVARRTDKRYKDKEAD